MPRYFDGFDKYAASDCNRARSIGKISYSAAWMIQVSRHILVTLVLLGLKTPVKEPWHSSRRVRAAQPRRTLLSSYPPDGSQLISHNVDVLRKKGIVGVVRVGGLQPEFVRPDVGVYMLDALDHQPVAVLEHEHLASLGEGPGGMRLLRTYLSDGR